MKAFLGLFSRIFTRPLEKEEPRNTEESEIDLNDNHQLVHRLVTKLANHPKIFTSAANTYSAAKEQKFLTSTKAAGKTLLATGTDFIKIPSILRKLYSNLGKGNFITGILENEVLYQLANIEPAQAQRICIGVINSSGFNKQKDKIGILLQFQKEELIEISGLSIAFIDTIKTNKIDLDKIGNNLAKIVSINKNMNKIKSPTDPKSTKIHIQVRANLLYHLEKDKKKDIISLIGNSLQAMSDSSSIDSFLNITEKLVEILDAKKLDPTKSAAIETIKSCERKIEELSNSNNIEKEEIKHLYIQTREEIMKKYSINIIDNLQFLMQQKLKIPQGSLKTLFRDNKPELALLAQEIIKYPEEKNILIQAAIDFKNSSPTEQSDKLITLIDAWINIAKNDNFINSISKTNTLTNFTHLALSLPQMEKTTIKLQKLFKGNIEGLYEVINFNSAEVLKGFTSLGNFRDYKGAKELIELSIKAQKESLSLKETLKKAIDIYTKYPDSMPKITEQLILNKKLIAERIDHALDKLDNNAAKGAIGWLKFANLKGDFFADLITKVNNPQDLKLISKCLEKPGLADGLNILIKHGSMPVSLAARTISAAYQIQTTVSRSIKTLSSYISPSITPTNTNLPIRHSPKDTRL